MSDVSPEEVQLLAREITDKVKREIPLHQFRSGTVRSYDAEFSRGVAVVHVDGDPSEDAISASNMAGTPLTIDQRVMLVFDPPSGVYVIGAAPLPTAAWVDCCPGGGGGA